MITSKQVLNEYLAKDKHALGIQKRRPAFLGDEIWKFEIALRKHEYYLNTKSNPFLEMYYRLRHHYLGISLGITIPCNVFAAGLRINHFGYLVVNSKAQIGEFCNINQGVNIGEGLDGGAPKIGDNVWIGPGAKIFGSITIGGNAMIGANSVVNKSFSDDGYRLAVVPAKAISKEGNAYFHFY